MSDSQEEIESKSELDASITKSAEAFEKHLAAEGVFHFLEPGKAGIEETVTFTNVMEDCDIKPEFINAVFELYKEVKRPLDQFKADELGIKLTDLIKEVDAIVTSAAAFYSHLEHGVDLCNK